MGSEMVRALRNKLPENVRVIDGGSAPENLLWKVRRLKPSHILLIDAAHFGGRPGELGIFPPDQISGVAISTHTMPLNILTELLEETGAKVILLGIEPKNLRFGEKISPEVREAVERGAEIIIESLKALARSEGG